MKLPSPVVVFMAVAIIIHFNVQGLPLHREITSSNELDDGYTAVDPYGEVGDSSFGGVVSMGGSALEDSSDSSSDSEEDADSKSNPAVTVINAGNLSGWVDQLDLQKALPLKEKLDGLPASVPIEVSIQIFDIQVNNNRNDKSGLFESLTYLADNYDEADSSDEGDDDGLISDDATLGLLGGEGQVAKDYDTTYLNAYSLNKALLKKFKEMEPVNPEQFKNAVASSESFCASLISKYSALLASASTDPNATIPFGTLKTAELYSLFQCHFAYTLLREAMKEDQNGSLQSKVANQDSSDDDQPPILTPTMVGSTDDESKATSIVEKVQSNSNRRHMVYLNKSKSSSPFNPSPGKYYAYDVDATNQPNSIITEPSNLVTEIDKVPISEPEALTQNDDKDVKCADEKIPFGFSDDEIGAMIFMMILLFFMVVFLLLVVNWLLEFIRKNREGKEQKGKTMTVTAYKIRTPEILETAVIKIPKSIEQVD